MLPRPACHPCLLVSALTATLLLVACGDAAPEADAEPGQREATTEERMDLEELLEREGTAEDDGPEEEAGAEDDELLIEPGTILGPGEIITRVGDVEVIFELPEEVEGGSVAPSDLPVSLELLADGGAIVVFEAVGHTRDDGDGHLTPTAGLPDDLEVWLTTDLPVAVEVADGPTALDDGIAVSLHNTDDEQSLPIVLWRAEGDPIDTFEGHGPPPAQTQQLWLRGLDGRWVGVATYGPDVDRDLADAIATSLRVR